MCGGRLGGGRKMAPSGKILPSRSAGSLAARAALRNSDAGAYLPRPRGQGKFRHEFAKDKRLGPDRTSSLTAYPWEAAAGIPLELNYSVASRFRQRD